MTPHYLAVERHLSSPSFMVVEGVLRGDARLDISRPVLAHTPGWHDSSRKRCQRPFLPRTSLSINGVCLREAACGHRVSVSQLTAQLRTFSNFEGSCWSCPHGEQKKGQSHSHISYPVECISRSHSQKKVASTINRMHSTYYSRITSKLNLKCPNAQVRLRSSIVQPTHYE